MVPMENNGAQFIYHKIIKPFVQKHEKELDEVTDAITEQAKDLTSHGEQVVY